jgi:hypothetical protein
MQALVKIPEKYRFIDNNSWNPEDENEERLGNEFVETPNGFWNFIRNMGWDEFACKKQTSILNIRQYSQAQRDIFIKHYGRLLRTFVIARSAVVPDIDECIMIGSHFMALGQDHFTNAMNDDDLVRNVHNAEAYGNFNGSLPPDWRYIHVHRRPNPLPVQNNVARIAPVARRVANDVPRGAQNVLANQVAEFIQFQQNNQQ